MAETVKMSVEQKMGRPNKYPWEEWFSKSLANTEVAIVCKQGVDFEVDLETFRNTIHGAARKSGLKAKTAVNAEEQTVAFQVSKRRGDSDGQAKLF